MKGKSARRWLAETVIAVAIVLLGTAGSGCTADPDALWKVVHDRCVPDQSGMATRHLAPSSIYGRETRRVTWSLRIW